MHSSRKPTGGFGAWRLADKLVLWALALVGLAASIFLLIAPRFVDAQEDAIILFQFSRNLALHGAITYIPNGPHAEGATDFLWMLMIAAAIRLGIDPAWFVAAMNFFAMAAIVFLLIRCIARERIRVVPALAVAGCFALMPQYFAAITGFSVLPFAALMLLLLFFYLSQNDVGMPLAALTLCLFRPDGTVFAIPMLVGALLPRTGRSRRFRLDVLLFALPGLAYFLWRWHYFGELLPLPFLVKSDTQRFLHLVVLGSLLQIKNFIVFTALLLLVFLRKHLADSQTRTLLVCFLGIPSLFYAAMRLDQNIGERFFIFIPVGLAAILALHWKDIGAARPALLPTGAAAWLLLLESGFAVQSDFAWALESTNREALVHDLGKLPHGRLVVTEAGLATYYTGWDAYDAWGLNTPEFAHRIFRPDDVAALHPDAILNFPAGPPTNCVPSPDWKTPYNTREWKLFSRNIAAGAADGHYDLFTLPSGSLSWRAHEHIPTWRGLQECWWVNPASPLHDSIVAALRAHNGITVPEWVAHQPPPSTAASAPLPRRSLPRRILSRLLFEAKILIAWIRQ